MTLEKGNVGLEEQQPEVEFVPGSGWTTTRVYHGTKTAVMAAGGQFAATGARVSARARDGGLYELRAMYGKLDGPPEQPIDDWELEGSDLQSDIKLHTYFGGLTTSELESIQSKIADRSVGFEFANERARELYQFLLRDQTHFQESRYVLRYTQTSSANSAAAIAVEGVNQLWTIGKIITTHPSLPRTVRAAINDIQEPTIPAAMQEDYIFRWLKHTPRLATANGKTVITVEWTLYPWARIVYPVFG